LIICALCAAGSYAFWIPGLMIQLSRENSSSVQKLSTGAVIPLTIFHFITGDRSLNLGFLQLSTVNLVTVIVFIGIITVMGIMYFQKSIKPDKFKEIFIIALAPLILQWLATLSIQRIFNATYYAIYSLPAILLLIALSIEGAKKGCKRLALILFISVIAINCYTAIYFYSNRLVKFEPWSIAAKFIKMQRPKKVFIYPNYMSVLLNFYNPELDIEGLPNKCKKMVAQIDLKEQNFKGKIIRGVLVISHARGAQQCYKNLFQSIADKKFLRYDFNHIQIYYFDVFRDFE
jgi:hypothetical protein